MLISINKHYQTLTEVLIDLRTELRKLAIGEGINHIAVESIRGFLTFNMNSEYNKEEKGYFAELDKEQWGKLLDQVKRLEALSHTYFKYFEHYWRCYVEGSTLAKYDLISYGESYIIAMLEILRLEEKLFNLTTRESIVQ